MYKVQWSKFYWNATRYHKQEGIWLSENTPSLPLLLAIPVVARGERTGRVPVDRPRDTWFSFSCPSTVSNARSITRSPCLTKFNVGLPVITMVKHFQSSFAHLCCSRGRQRFGAMTERYTCIYVLLILMPLRCHSDQTGNWWEVDLVNHCGRYVLR